MSVTKIAFFRRYGKTSKEGAVVNPLVKLIQIPKSAFGHFYVFAGILMPRCSDVRLLLCYLLY